MTKLPRQSTPTTVIKYLKCSVASALLILLVIIQIQQSESHGRLIEPPSRASAWRYGFNTPPNYNDHELFCGGYTRQHQTNGKFIKCQKLCKAVIKILCTYRWKMR